MSTKAILDQMQEHLPIFPFFPQEGTVTSLNPLPKPPVPGHIFPFLSCVKVT
jgi:hypothetical protein